MTVAPVKMPHKSTNCDGETHAVTHYVDIFRNFTIFNVKKCTRTKWGTLKVQDAIVKLFRSILLERSVQQIKHPEFPCGQSSNHCDLKEARGIPGIWVKCAWSIPICPVLNLFAFTSLTPQEGVT